MFENDQQNSRGYILHIDYRLVRIVAYLGKDSPATHASNM